MDVHPCRVDSTEPGRTTPITSATRGGDFSAWSVSGSELGSKVARSQPTTSTPLRQPGVRKLDFQSISRAEGTTPIHRKHPNKIQYRSRSRSLCTCPTPDTARDTSLCKLGRREGTRAARASIALAPLTARGPPPAGTARYSRCPRRTTGIAMVVGNLPTYLSPSRGACRRGPVHHMNHRSKRRPSKKLVDSSNASSLRALTHRYDVTLGQLASRRQGGLDRKELLRTLTGAFASEVDVMNGVLFPSCSSAPTKK